MNRAVELIEELVSIPDHELEKVPTRTFSMIRGMCDRLSEHDTLGQHAVCRERLVELGRENEKLEAALRKAQKGQV